MERKSQGIREPAMVLLIMAMIFAGMTYNFVINHELTHAQIFNIYGYNSTIEWGLVKSTTWPGPMWKNITMDEFRDMNILQAQLEIEAVNQQNLLALAIAFFVGLWFLRYAHDD